MKKKIFPGWFLAVVLVISLWPSFIQPASALNVLNRMLYKKVALICIHRYVLVHRMTGQVEYILSLQGKWVPVGKALQNQYQSMYRVQYQRDNL